MSRMTDAKHQIKTNDEKNKTVWVITGVEVHDKPQVEGNVRGVCSTERRAMIQVILESMEMLIGCYGLDAISDLKKGKAFDAETFGPEFLLVYNYINKYNSKKSKINSFKKSLESLSDEQIERLFEKYQRVGSYHATIEACVIDN